MLFKSIISSFNVNKQTSLNEQIINSNELTLASYDINSTTVIREFTYRFTRPLWI